jgi:hypothetical protein
MKVLSANVSPYNSNTKIAAPTTATEPAQFTTNAAGTDNSISEHEDPYLAQVIFF